MAPNVSRWAWVTLQQGPIDGVLMNVPAPGFVSKLVQTSDVNCYGNRFSLSPLIEPYSTFYPAHIKVCTYTVGYVRSTWRPFPTRSPEISFLLRFEVIQHFCWCKSDGNIAGRMDLSTYFVFCSMLLQCPGQQQWRRVEEERPPSCFSRLYGIARGLPPMQTVQLNAELKLRKRRIWAPLQAARFFVPSLSV